MRIDAHQHFWNYSAEEYGWINDAMTTIRRDFLPRNLKPLLAAEGLNGSIAVQARQTVEETRWLLELADKNDFIQGVVGWVDLSSPELAAQLERFSKDSKLVGVRHILHDEPDDEFMLRPEFRRGIARLANYRLTYDLLLFPKHLPLAVKLVREFPRQKFVLDHIGKPRIGEGLMEPWERDLRELAKFENVWCKVSGMVTEARWKGWKPDDFTPYLDVVFEAFGPNRIMMGSDWPVCTVAASYADTMCIVKDYIEQFGPEEREAVLGGNCAESYDVQLV